jgi:hypothetical protein
MNTLLGIIDMSCKISLKLFLKIGIVIISFVTALLNVRDIWFYFSSSFKMQWMNNQTIAAALLSVN